MVLVLITSQREADEFFAVYSLPKPPKPRVFLRERADRLARSVGAILRWLLSLTAILGGITAVLLVVAAVATLISHAAHAGTLVRDAGWQIHVFYTKPVNDRMWITIGPPMLTKQLCEDTSFSIMIEHIHDSVRCVWVGELWTN